jgi:diguanylate cyclase (GGDEF)-like protein
MEFISLKYMFFITTVMLVLSFLYNVKQRRIIDELKGNCSDMMQDTFYDSVTDLPNRNNIEIIINENIYVASRRDKSFCVLGLKILNYKDVKSESIEESNKLAMEVADGILSSIRDEDTAARISDDEYIVVFNEYLEAEHYDIPMGRISDALKGKEIRYSYITYPSEAKSTDEIIEGVLAKI